MSTSLVTGGAGFIGSHVADELIKLGDHVVVLDDLSGGFRENVPVKAEFVEGTILDVSLVNALFDRFHFDSVYHLAAYAAEGLSHFIKRYNYMTNLIGSVNLINSAVNHEVKCFVFTSSVAVYGTGQVPFVETTHPIPEDSYGISKLAVELELAATKHLFGMNYIVFRPHNVYGERQNISDLYRNVIGIFMNQLLDHRPMTIFGDGEQQRAFTYIGDIAPVIARSVHESSLLNQVFNIGADTPYTINYLAKAVAKEMGKECKTVHLPRRQEVEQAYSFHERLRKLVGYEARVSLEDGLARMAAWAQLVGRRMSKPFSAVEISKNLPAVWRQG